MKRKTPFKKYWETKGDPRGWFGALEYNVAKRAFEAGRRSKPKGRK